MPRYLKQIAHLLAPSWHKHETTQSAQQRLQAILQVAEQIAQRNPLALRDLVRLLGRPVQAAWMSQVLVAPKAVPSVASDEVLFPCTFPFTEAGSGLSALLEREDRPRTLSLATDLVLPFSWNRSSLANCLADIGSTKASGPWRENTNHIVECWEPIGVGWVINGCHSIIAGILQGEGTITVSSIYHMRQLYDLIECDGTTYRLRRNRQLICPVRCVEFAGIFEIGRMMLKQGILKWTPMSRSRWRNRE